MFKILFLLSLIALGYSVVLRGHQPPLSHFLVQNSVNNLLGTLRRSKRHIVDFESVQCMQSCVSRMTQALERIGLSMQDNAGGVLNHKLYNGNTFQRYCEITLAAKRCIAGCGMDGQSNSIMSSAFKAVEYLCEDHLEEFQEALPCYQSVDEESKSVCFPRCGDPKELTRRSQAALQRATMTMNLGRISKLLEEQCKFLKCSIKCFTGLIRDSCDSEEPAILLHDFAQVTLQAVQNMLENIPQATSFWPPTCRRIATANLPEIVDRESPEVENELEEEDEF